MRISLCLSLAPLVLATASGAVEPPKERQCGNLAAITDELEKSYLDDLAIDLEEIRDRARKRTKEKTDEIDAVPDSYEFETGMELTEFKMDVPEFKVSQQRIVLDLPQMEIVQTRMTFHTPAMCEKMKKIGQYPEFRCRGFKCTVKWTDIKTKIWEPCSKLQEIVVGVPEFKVARTEILIPVIETKMTTQKMSLHVPQFTVRDPEEEVKKRIDHLEEIRADANAELDRLNVTSIKNLWNDSVATYHRHFACLKRDLLDSRIQFFGEFDDALSKVMLARLTLIATIFGQRDSEETKSFEVAITAAFRERTTASETWDQAVTDAIDALDDRLASAARPLERYQIAAEEFHPASKSLRDQRSKEVEAMDEVVAAYMESLRLTEADMLARGVAAPTGVIVPDFEAFLRDIEKSRQDALGEITDSLDSLDQAEEGAISILSSKKNVQLEKLGAS